MQTKSALLNDFSKLVTGAFGIAQNAKSEMETAVSSMVERWLAERDFVNREEFEAVKAMAQKNVERNAELLKLVSHLENRINKLEPKGLKKPRLKKD